MWVKIATKLLGIVIVSAGIAHADNKGKAVGPNGCPPGLAKKSPKCIPPGLAKKGERIDDRYSKILDLDRYQLDRRGATYYHLADEVFRVDPETREILETMGVLQDLLISSH